MIQPGLTLIENAALRTRDVFEVRVFAKQVVLAVKTAECFRLMIRGVVWHDFEGHCPTWSGECRCDLGGEA